MSNPLIEPDHRLIIAHRGASAEALENTLQAARPRPGADALNWFVRLTGREVVVIHDPTLDRTTDRAAQSPS
jgi:glycerophosphoryl diester phosphodiesterase